MARKFSDLSAAGQVRVFAPALGVLVETLEPEARAVRIPLSELKQSPNLGVTFVDVDGAEMLELAIGDTRRRAPVLDERARRIGHAVLEYAQKDGVWSFDFRRVAERMMREDTAEGVIVAALLHELADALDAGKGG